MGNGETISSVTPLLVKYQGSSKGIPTHTLLYNTNESHWIIKKSKYIMYMYENTIMRLISIYN